MDSEEKRLRLEAIEIALEEVEKIIDIMQEKQYPKEQINEYNKKRWELWNERYQIKTS